MSRDTLLEKLVWSPPTPWGRDRVGVLELALIKNTTLEGFGDNQTFC